MDPRGLHRPAAATDSLLLVNPEIAVKQRATELPATPGRAEPPAEEKAKEGKDSFRPDPYRPGVHRKVMTRFYGVKTLKPDRIAPDFKNVAEEVIAYLRQEGIDLAVRVEIEATKSTGFDEGQIRTVSENARTLKFDQSGFEES